MNILKPMLTILRHIYTTLFWVMMFILTNSYKIQIEKSLWASYNILVRVIGYHSQKTEFYAL